MYFKNNKTILMLFLAGGIAFVAFLYSPIASPELYNSTGFYMAYTSSATKIEINKGAQIPNNKKAIRFAQQGQSVYSGIPDNINGNSNISVDKVNGGMIAGNSTLTGKTTSNISVFTEKTDHFIVLGSTKSNEGGNGSSKSSGLNSGSLTASACALTSDATGGQSNRQSAPAATNGFSGGPDPGGDPTGDPLPIGNGDLVISTITLIYIGFIFRKNHIKQIFRTKPFGQRNTL